MLEPYELPQQQYALWYDVGARLGVKTQAIVGDALCTGTFRIQTEQLIIGEDEIIKDLAAYRGISLSFC